jgi:hypothetical protein
MSFSNALEMQMEILTLYVRITWQKFRKPLLKWYKRTIKAKTTEHSKFRNPPFFWPSKPFNLVTTITN